MSFRLNRQFCFFLSQSTMPSAEILQTKLFGIRLFVYSKPNDAALCEYNARMRPLFETRTQGFTFWQNNIFVPIILSRLLAYHLKTMNAVCNLIGLIIFLYRDYIEVILSDAELHLRIMDLRR